MEQPPLQRTPTPERSAARKPSPRRPLHATSDVRPYSQSVRTESASATKSKSMVPFWVKVLAILIIAVIVFLVIRNLESDPVTKIPGISIEV